MGGGNDGLNTVVPYTDPIYAASRPTLHLKASEVHKIDSQLGFHPRMTAFYRLYREGLVSVVQGVGYPNPSQDHAVSMHIWQTADPTRVKFAQTGWLGRVIDQVTRDDPGAVPGVVVGQVSKTWTMNATRSIVPLLSSLEEARLRSWPSEGVAHRRRLVEAAAAARASDGGLLNFLQRTTLAAYHTSDHIEAAVAADAANTAVYPPFRLAKTLRMVAQLIRADVGLRFFSTEVAGGDIGAFDNHAGQAPNHAALLGQFSESVAAFLDDLKRDKILDRVLLMTFSEFGRTVLENGRRGTDHGSAAPMFLAGSRVKGGLIGKHPNLTDLENGGQRHHTDFRRVYATVLDRWLGLDSQAILGGKFQHVDVLRV